jgi:hypothetical protein
VAANIAIAAANTTIGQIRRMKHLLNWLEFRFGLNLRPNIHDIQAALKYHLPLSEAFYYGSSAGMYFLGHDPCTFI